MLYRIQYIVKQYKLELFNKWFAAYIDYVQ